MYVDSIKEMFPTYLIPKVMNSDKYAEKLSEEQRLQAKKYLEDVYKRQKYIRPINYNRADFLR